MINDLKIQHFLNYLERNNNLERLTTNIDNNRASVHRWFPFLVGFSHKLVSETIDFFKLNGKDYTLYDPFIGSGTTGVVGKNHDINVIGNESNPFLYRICKIKTSQYPNPAKLKYYGKEILGKASKKWKSIDIADENLILEKCYSLTNLKKMIALREAINSSIEIPQKYRKFFFLALTMSLPKLSNVAINVPYLSWRCKRTPEETFLSFNRNLQFIYDDLNEAFSHKKSSSKIKIYLHDSRKQNKWVKKNSIDMIFTSPPYLNNFDYGEALKIFLYFWKMTKNWPDITSKIRKPSISSATTYYLGSEYSLKSADDILGDEFLKKFPTISQEITNKMESIKKIRENKSKSKSFDILVALYFKDMSKVLHEIHEVLKKNGLAFFVIGDSAPYGIHILTDNLLGEMAVNLGFSSFTLEPLRIRGTKWTTLKHRHNLKLRESLLIIRK